MNKSVKSWLEFAHRDLIAAEELLKNDYLTNISLFHSQQCIEKSLKALLEFFKIFPPKVHSINKLFSLLPEEIRSKIPLTEEEINLIDDIYIDTRYPGNFGLLPSGFPSQKQATKVLNISKKVFFTINEIVGGSYENR